jgi:phage-related baseplate assembly protein
MPNNLPDTARAPGIDLSLLPPPDLIEPLDYETILTERQARLLERVPAERRPEITATLALESEPLTILLQEIAYRELLLRSRINDAARQCMLASARGSNLDHLAALYGVTRLMIAPGDPDAIPPIPPTWETDTRLRARTQLAPEGMSTAGPVESYRFHALSAHGGVLDAGITSPVPGQVIVTILGLDGDGTPAPEILDAVTAQLNRETIRPLTDQIIIQPAEIVPFAITATLTLYPGPSAGPVLENIQSALTDTLHALRRIGYDIRRSALYSALHREGVQNVQLTEPANDLIITDTQSATCTAINLQIAGAPDV